jgi:hypothetical protein
MATTKTISFRCPDEMLDFIEQQAQKSGVDKTAVIMKLLELGKSALGDEGIDAIQPSDTVRQIVQEAIAPLQAQIEELRGKLVA